MSAGEKVCNFVVDGGEIGLYLRGGRLGNRSVTSWRSAGKSASSYVEVGGQMGR